MITITKPTYKCEHCRKLYQMKSACVAHEPRCVKNPVNKRPCFDCEISKMLEVDHRFDAYDGEHTETIKVLGCILKKQYLVPPKAEHKGNYYEGESLGDGEQENVPMPRTCDSYKEFLPF